MSVAGAASPYTMRRVQQMLGISRLAIQRLVNAGFVTPTRGARNEVRFSFQDLMLLRTAQGLQEAQIPPRKILRSLRQLRATLPGELPLTGMRITAVGTGVAVRDRHSTWEARSGQLLLDFEVAAVDGSVAFLAPSPAATASDADARQLLADGGRWRAQTRRAPKPPTERRSPRRPTTSMPTSISAPCFAICSATRTPSSSTSTRCLAVRTRPCCSSITRSRSRSSGACASLR
jgi:hypothetical protein